MSKLDNPTSAPEPNITSESHKKPRTGRGFVKRQALTDIMQERTTIIIAHRLATVINADRIVVMDEGQVTDSGPHYKLMKRCELYQRLARLQLQSQ